MTLHIYSPSFRMGRAVRKCTTCRRRRRFLVRVYGWHPSVWVCGGCGYSFCEGRRRDTVKKRKDNREFVRKEWNSSMKLIDAIREITSIT